MTTPNYYAIIPADVRYNNNLTFLERFLYCEITALSNNYGYCFAKNEYFCELYKKTPETISRAINNLKKENHIIIDYEYEGSVVKNRKIYPLTQKQATDIFVNGKQKAIDIFNNGERQKMLSAIDKKVKDNTITYLDIFNIITKYKKETKVSSKNTQNFERFYACYPRKENKAKTEKAFNKLNPSTELLETMIQAVKKQYGHFKKEDFKYVPHPSTWINGRRWEDEAMEENKTNKWQKLLEGEII